MTSGNGGCETLERPAYLSRPHNRDGTCLGAHRKCKQQGIAVLDVWEWGGRVLYRCLLGAEPKIDRDLA